MSDEVVVGRRTITRRGKGKKLIDQRTEEVTMAKDLLKDILGDGKARVSKALHLRESGEISRSTWLTGEVSTEVTLTCDQSVDGIEEADEAAWELVQEKTLDGVQWVHDWIESIRSDD